MKFSYSAINTYTQCGYKYKLRYRNKLKSKYLSGALAFGSAIDNALNVLLTTKDESKAKDEFLKHWNFQFINKVYTPLKDSELLVYAETDYDIDLLKEEDKEELNKLNPLWQQEYSDILENKKSKGWENIPIEKKKFYNMMNWLSMRHKGLIMIHSYNKEIIPTIEEVIVVQKEQSLSNEDGDTLIQYLDLIAKLKDGRTILFDNKTSARDYDPDQALRSPQLISYYHSSKDEYKLDGIGFYVLKKNILKNKIKTCSVCGYDGTKGRARTCDDVQGGIRCSGEWDIKINPKCYIQTIINEVPPSAEDLVIEAFDSAAENIKKENFYKNLSACKNGPIICEYYNHCWWNKNDDVIEVP